MFGVSASKSTSSSKGQSTSSSTSRQGSTSASLSGGTSTSRNQSQGTSTQSIAFEDVFSRLFQGAEGAAAGLDTSLLTDASNQLFAGGTDFLNSIGGDAGSEFLASRLEGANDLQAEQLQLLQTDIGKLFNEELLPAITGEAVSGGQLGGGRQGVAQGRAVDSAADAFTKGAVDIRTRNQAQLDELAAGVASRNIQGAQIGLAGLGNLSGVMELGFGAELAPFERLSALLGGPQTLTQSEQAATGFSDAADFARAFSDSFGRSDSESQSSTESKSKSVSGGIGFSDRRLKRNVKPAGTRKGLAWYTWTFVWGEPGEGVMADEVPDEFVITHPSGYKMVDYGRLMA